MNYTITDFDYRLIHVYKINLTARAKGWFSLPLPIYNKIITAVSVTSEGPRNRQPTKQTANISSGGIKAKKVAQTDRDIFVVWRTTKRGSRMKTANDARNITTNRKNWSVTSWQPLKSTTHEKQCNRRSTNLSLLFFSLPPFGFLSSLFFLIKKQQQWKLKYQFINAFWRVEGHGRFEGKLESNWDKLYSYANTEEQFLNIAIKHGYTWTSLVNWETMKWQRAFLVDVNLQLTNMGVKIRQKPTSNAQNNHYTRTTERNKKYQFVLDVLL